MCEKCFAKGFESFPSLKSFEEFKSAFKKLKKANFQHIRNGNLKFPYDEYACKNCHEIWWISEPERAWRGYCLKKDHAITYVQKLQKYEQNAKIALVLFVLFVITFFLWNL